MKPGEIITVKATVLRVDGKRVDAQLGNGELLQTHVANVENKQIKSAPENKQVKPKENK